MRQKEGLQSHGVSGNAGKGQLPEMRHSQHEVIQPHARLQVRERPTEKPQQASQASQSGTIPRMYGMQEYNGHQDGQTDVVSKHITCYRQYRHIENGMNSLTYFTFLRNVSFE